MSEQKKNQNVNPDTEELTEEGLSEQRRIRREKLKNLQEAGRNPYLIEKWDVNAYSQDIKDRFEEMDGKEVSIAGRMMAKRGMGKASFIDIQDSKGRIQCHVKKDVLGEEEYKWFKTSDIGDLFGIVGKVFQTQRGEITVEVSKMVLLSKSLQVLPNKWHGLKDTDIRYRQRYVDLIMNQDVKDTFIKRAAIIKEIKRVLEEDFGYLEVDTPILTTIAGGANARPFETHHNTLDLDMKLRISNELYLKRLVVGGLDRVYEMGKMFRNEGMDRNHNPEFTSMECYMAYEDMEKTMEVTEQVVSKAALKATGSMVIEYQGKKFDLTPPWRRLRMSDAVKEITGVDFDQIQTDEEARTAAIGQGMDKDEVQEMTRGKILAEMFEEYCEDVPGYLDGPVFVVGHPVEISPLAKRDPEDPRITRRFEAYINGWEIANAFSELNDPIDQYERFKEQQAQLDDGSDDEAHPMDEDFVNALEVGLPPTGGLGIGIDRVIMLITNAPSIRDIILFPTMKPLDSDSKKAKKPAAAAPEKIDFSNVEIEPLFEDMVDFDTFSKSDFRAVKIKECEAVPKSKKLLKFVLDDGTDEDRVILSGIHDYYEPEELVGKTAIAIVNLPPRKMMGIDSCGMLISAVHHEKGEERLHLLMVDDHIPAGAKLY
ncbi:lysine--tRNA ligase [Zhenpiania hominis]|uniref:Lysine--tRNA ligase n=1 Tax=Zhenpiania hominis TaxID=2763644 RepID=A0A923SR57_9FIRM|nr:lysine--tRNA ligase [Zhenpiania hominis]MBC6678959.1 lysine--tRNA ligase [Zhenpiania hominis]